MKRSNQLSNNFFFFLISDAVYLAAMGKAGGGRNEVDPRFISMFSLYNVTFPTEATLNYIYTSILTGHLLPFPEEVQALSNILIQMTLELYKAK